MDGLVYMSNAWLKKGQSTGNKLQILNRKGHKGMIR